MNIAIIGGGLTGLTAAYELLKSRHRVTVFEKEKTLGGLAGGFKKDNWQWNLEFFYHHFFTNDTTLINLAKELGLEKDMLILRPITATLIQKTQKAQDVRKSENSESQTFRISEYPTIRHSDSPSILNIPKNIYQLDSPLNLLTFPILSPTDKLRTAALLAFCKLNPLWQPLEKIPAEKFFRIIGGTHAWNILWRPLMEGKFGAYAKNVPASWLWARFHKRTMKLGYFRGGFQTFVDTLTYAIKQRGGIIYTNTDITSIKRDVRNTMYEIRIKQNNHSYIVNRTSYFDKVLITTPSSTATKLIQFPKPYEQKLKAIPHLWAQTLILETKEPLLKNTYWLNIIDKSFPFIAVVSHTNMVDKKHYGGNHITYIGNYLPDGHPFLTMTGQQLLRKFLPYLQQINPSIPSYFVPRTSYLINAPSAQPVHTLNYSKKAPAIQTPIKGIYLANLDSIYPWDRGTNYAIALGQTAAKTMIKN